MTVELKLVAGNATEQRVLDYLAQNASEALAGKINGGAKTLAGAMNYAKDEAKNMAQDSGMVMVDDATVFGWIVHYFEEDSITENAKRPVVRVPAGVSTTPKEAGQEQVEKAKRHRKLKVTEKYRDEFEKDDPPARRPREAKRVDPEPEAEKPPEPVKPAVTQLGLFDAIMGGPKA